MAELRDPSKPARHLVEIRDDGSALRNDGEELRPANQNPWYVLMTLAGEVGDQPDQELLAANRLYWDAWTSGETLDGVPSLFKSRLPGVEIPKHSHEIQMTRLYLPKGLHLDGFVLRNVAMSIQHSHIGGDSSFQNCQFGQTFFARGCTFEHFATFVGTAFHGSARFRDCDFHSGADFSGCQFKGTANFYAARFSKDANFARAKFQGEARFAKAEFEGAANFSDGPFDGATSFKNAKFRAEVPAFYQRTFHQDSDFTIRPRAWPNPDKTPTYRVSDQKRAYSRLAHVMSELHKPDDEQFFRRQEMRCKRRLGTWIDWLFLSLYAATSRYGYSIGRPIGWLGVTVLGGAAVFALPALRQAGTLANAVSAVFEQLGPSFSGTFAFLGFLRRFHPDFFANGPWWFETISGAQTILGVVLLFFLGLGLRNRFRLK